MSMFSQSLAQMLIIAMIHKTITKTKVLQNNQRKKVYLLCFRRDHQQTLLSSRSLSAVEEEDFIYSLTFQHVLQKARAII